MTVLLVCRFSHSTSLDIKESLIGLSEACAIAIRQARSRGDKVLHLFEADPDSLRTLTGCHANGSEVIFKIDRDNLQAMPSLSAVISNNRDTSCELIGIIDADTLICLHSQMRSLGIQFEVNPEAARIVERVTI